MLMPRYAELVYYGFWFSPEREMLQALIDRSQRMSMAGSASAVQGQCHRGQEEVTEIAVF